MWRKHKQVREEAGKFSFVGIIATTVDFAFLNIGTIWLHLPLIVANLASATISSVVSFTLNRRLTFGGQRHGDARTILRYVIIMGFSIYVIQNLVLLLLENHLDSAAAAILKDLGWRHISSDIVGNNAAKAIAAWLASIWNFFMLRRFVFLPSDHPDANNGNR